MSSLENEKILFFPVYIRQSLHSQPEKLDCIGWRLPVSNLPGYEGSHRNPCFFCKFFL
nr:MAG TPA: hypothetical protein [Caudoviricetes sp.]